MSLRERFGVGGGAEEQLTERQQVAEHLMQVIDLRQVMYGESADNTTQAILDSMSAKTMEPSAIVETVRFAAELEDPEVVKTVSKRAFSDLIECGGGLESRQYSYPHDMAIRRSQELLTSYEATTEVIDMLDGVLSPNDSYEALHVWRRVGTITSEVKNQIEESINSRQLTILQGEQDADPAFVLAKSLDLLRNHTGYRKGEEIRRDLIAVALRTLETVNPEPETYLEDMATIYNSTHTLEEKVQVYWATVGKGTYLSPIVDDAVESRDQKTADLQAGIVPFKERRRKYADRVGYRAQRKYKDANHIVTVMNAKLRQIDMDFTTSPAGKFTEITNLPQDYCIQLAQTAEGRELLAYRVGSATPEERVRMEEQISARFAHEFNAFARGYSKQGTDSQPLQDIFRYFTDDLGLQINPGSIDQ